MNPPKHIVAVAALVTNAQSHVLMIRSPRRDWEFPGGQVEEGESPVDTAIREVREETGLSVVALQMTGYYHDREAGGLHFVFRCEVENDEVDARPDGTEISECGYWRPEALPRPISDFTVLRIHDVLAGTSYPLPTTIGPRQWLE